MIEPISLPPPKDAVQRIHRFVRDLAWGAVNNQWGANLRLFRGELNEPDTQLNNYMESVWNGRPPQIGVLEAFAYVKIEGNACQLTEKAFALLDAAPPIAIFISYRRHVSSAVALMIWADLRAEGLKPFLDIRSIAPGDEWHSLLERRVKGCNVFISVIGPHTLESEYVCKEIQWALEVPDVRMIPVLHGGFSPSDFADSPFPDLQHKNLVVVEEDNAQDLYNALEQLKTVFALFG